MAVLAYSSVHEDCVSAEAAGMELAKDIASKSPVAVQGSKVNLIYSRDHSVEESLEYCVSKETYVHVCV